MTENVRSFEKALRESEELQQKFQAELKRVAEAEEAKSEAEAVVRASEALGYGFTASDYEKACAEMQKLDVEEMAAVTGGDDSVCLKDYHCFTAWKHPDQQNKDGACAYDWSCVFFWKHDMKTLNDMDTPDDAV